MGAEFHKAFAPREAMLLNMKILIVDDEPVNVILLQELLDEAGYKCFEATTDSRHVLSLFEQFQPDLVLLDMMMPHIDGFGVMEQLHGRLPADSYLPILVLTADVRLETRQRALSAGATDFLTKPFDHIEVLLRVRNLLYARLQHIQLMHINQLLEEKIQERTRELRELRQHLCRRTLGLDESQNNLKRAQDLMYEMHNLLDAAEDAATLMERY